MQTDTFETPVGTVTHITKSTPSSWARLTVKEWVCTEEDLKVFTYIEQHTNWAFSQETFDQFKCFIFIFGYLSEFFI